MLVKSKSKAVKLAPKRQSVAVPGPRSLSVPAARYNPTTTGYARVTSMPDGATIITHSEKFSDVSLPTASNTPSGGFLQAFPLVPSAVPWLGGVAAHWELFSWEAVRVRFVAATSSTVTCPVTLAPFYNYKLPYVASGNSGLFPIGELPGANQFAVWASGVVGNAAGDLTKSLGTKLGYGKGLDRVSGAVNFVANRFSRFLFRTVGFDVYANGLGAEPEAEFQRPGWVLLLSNNAESSALNGSLWIDYRIRLLDPRPAFGPHLALRSTSTDSSALALSTAPAIGSSVAFTASGNTIQFWAPGRYRLSVHAIGTNPVIASGSLTVVTQSNVTKTVTAFVPAYSVGGSDFTASTDSSTNSVLVSSATAGYFDAYLQVAVGDILTIPALTSGSVTSTLINLDQLSGLAVDVKA